jgi:hypothetical protein
MLLLLFLLAADDADHVLGAPIPSGSRKLDDVQRVASSRDYDDTIEFYEKLFKGNSNYRWRPILTAPGLKAVHFQNIKSVGGWSGLNIYEHNNRVRIYVLTPEAPAPAPSKATQKQ